MTAGKLTQGRRRPDQRYFEIPEDVQPGDYWRCLHRKTNEPMHADHLVEGHDAAARGNLTGGVWGVACPDHDELIGCLTLHTAREHEDGTISVRPGDGSSNSILITMPPLASWHGYIEHGVWSEI